MMGALEYFEGLPQAALTDRMKSVFLQMDASTPIWNPVSADVAACLGRAARVCQPRKAQTKGKIERSVGIIKDGFWPGVRFTEIDALHEPARAWCDRLNQKVHRTTQCVPMDRWIEEQLRPLPTDDAWERFGAEERKVSPTGAVRKTPHPLGHQLTPPTVEIGNLAEYDQLFSLEVAP